LKSEVSVGIISPGVIHEDKKDELNTSVVSQLSEASLENNEEELDG